MSETKSALDVIKGFEGYSDKAYWDVNHFRAGYGSDTTTLADGTVQPISRESVVNRDDSERDLARRTADFAKGASDTIGPDKWNALPGNVQSALTSTAYNYGSLTKVPAVVRAAQAGDIEGIAQGLEGVKGHNGGVNSGRRQKEADIVRGAGGTSADYTYTASTEVPLTPTAAVAGTPRVTPEEGPGWVDTAIDAWQQNSPTANILRSSPLADDPNWQKPNVQKLEADLKSANLDPERYAKFLGGSTSEAGYMRQIQYAQADRDRMERLGQAGLKGIVLDFATQALDPVNIAIDGATAAVAPEVILGKYGYKIGRVLSAALAGGAAGLAQSAVNYGFNPNSTQEDLLLGTVVGMGLGAVVGRLKSNPATAREGQGLQDIGHQIIAEHEGVPYVPRGSMGAAYKGDGKFYIDHDALNALEHGDIPATAFRPVRGDLSARGDASLNPGTRAVMGGLVQDGTGKVGGAINGTAASEDKLLLESEHMAAFHRTYQPMRKQFIDAGGTKDDFNSRVFSYIEDRRINRNDFYPEEVRKAGDAFATVRASELKLQKNARVREGGEARPVQGADLTPENKNYVPHEWDTVKVNLLNEHLEEDAVRLTLKGGLRKANLNADEATLDRISTGMLKTLSGRGAGIDKNDFIARISGADVEDALKALVEHHGITEEDSKAFFAAFKKQKAAKDDAGNATPFKTRALIDVDYKLPYRPKVRDTGVEWDRDLTLKDLLNTDIEHLNNKYTNRAAGNIALARMHIINPATGETIVNGVTSNAEWAGLLKDLEKKGANSGQTEAQIAMDAKRLNYAYEMIKGTYQHDMSSNGFGKFLRVVQKYNFIRVMNQVGLAQIPELANNVGSAGLTATMQQLPGFRRIVGRDGVMHLKDGFGDDLEAVFGHGLDHWTRSAEERYDAALDAIKTSKGQKFDARYQKLNSILDKGARITNMMSGMHGIDTMSRRWAYKAIVQKFANAAAGRASFSEKRLADMGLSPSMFERVKVELQNVDNVSMDGKKVTGLKLDNWQDKEASEAFRRAVHRKANEVIQKNDIGNMAMWMGTPLGKTLMQFRTFMAASYVKHTLKGLYMHDPEVMINAAVGMAVAAGVYEVQTRINAVGRSDADKYLKDRLSPDKIAESAFAKVGISSVIPMLVDTAITPMGYKPLFSYSRTTGQASDLWLSNPAKGLVDDFSGALGAARGIANGNPSQQELRSINKLMPFNNAFGYLQLFNAGISTAPERTPQGRRKPTELFQ